MLKSYLRNWGSFGLVPFHLVLQQSRDPGGHHRTHSTLAQFMASVYAQMRESRARSYPSADRRSYRFEFEQTARTGRGHNCILGRARDCSKTTNLSQPILRERRRVLADRQGSRQDPEHEERLRRALVLDLCANQTVSRVGNATLMTESCRWRGVMIKQWRRRVATS